MALTDNRAKALDCFRGAQGGVDGFIRGNSKCGTVELGDEWHLLEIKAMASAKYTYADDDDTYSTPLANKSPFREGLARKG